MRFPQFIVTGYLLFYSIICERYIINNYVPLFFGYSDEATLNSLARERGFAVQDVPGDGDCLFSAVGLQLENIGIQSGRRNLRAELVEHLQSSPYTHDSSHLRNYVSAPVIADDPLNADTEAPTRQDEVISSIEDADLRQQLRWLQYLETECRCLGRSHSCSGTG